MKERRKADSPPKQSFSSRGGERGRKEEVLRDRKKKRGKKKERKGKGKGKGIEMRERADSSGERRIRSYQGKEDKGG